jgi:AraC-like DNA-binding protein
MQSGAHPDAIEPIQDVSVMLLDNMKLYFLFLYLLIIFLFILFLNRMNNKKKQEVSQHREGYFIEKMMHDTENNRTGQQARNATEDKELMSCEVKEEILKKLLVFEEGTKYTDKNFNLSALSVKLKINTKYLSYIINKYKKKDFNTYINELRILYIIKKMETNPAYVNYKISYLADECGFSSHSKFTSVFRSVVGMSPSRFMDMLTKRAKQP